jgi:hypothetical protein
MVVPAAKLGGGVVVVVAVALLPVLLPQPRATRVRAMAKATKPILDLIRFVLLLVGQ